MKNVSIIFLAGGQGLRIGGNTPKQYLSIKGKPLFKYSLDILKDFGEVVVVADQAYQSHFPYVLAEPGKRRQDSVYNGFQKCTHDWILIHDAARPFIKKEQIENLIEEGMKVGAATLAHPVASTIKQTNSEGFVLQTLDRSHLWDIQTPQLLRRDLLQRGFEKALQDHLTVTDDVALAELIHHPVKLVKSSPLNFKITSKDDLKLAEALLGGL